LSKQLCFGIIVAIGHRLSGNIIAGSIQRNIIEFIDYNSTVLTELNHILMVLTLFVFKNQLRKAVPIWQSQSA